MLREWQWCCFVMYWKGDILIIGHTIFGKKNQIIWIVRRRATFLRWSSQLIILHMRNKWPYRAGFWTTERYSVKDVDTRAVLREEVVDGVSGILLVYQYGRMKSLLVKLSDDSVFDSILLNWSQNLIGTFTPLAHHVETIVGILNRHGTQWSSKYFHSQRSSPRRIIRNEATAAQRTKSTLNWQIPQLVPGRKGRIQV